MVEQAALTRAIADNKGVLVRNQGLLARGHTIEEAWSVAGLAVHACETQVRLASSVGSNQLILLPARDDEKACKCTRGDSNELLIELQFESLMRALDAAGYRTGYLYRHASVLAHRKKRLLE